MVQAFVKHELPERSRALAVSLDMGDVYFRECRVCQSRKTYALVSEDIYLIVVVRFRFRFRRLFPPVRFTSAVEACCSVGVGRMRFSPPRVGAARSWFVWSSRRGSPHAVLINHWWDADCMHHTVRPVAKTHVRRTDVDTVGADISIDQQCIQTTTSILSLLPDAVNLRGRLVVGRSPSGNALFRPSGVLPRGVQAWDETKVPKLLSERGVLSSCSFSSRVRCPDRVRGA